MSVAGLCRHLSLALGKPLVDKTALTGIFDFHLDITMSELMAARTHLGPPGSSGTDDTGGSVFTAVRNLGLQIKRSTGAAKVIVVDHIELPSPN